MQFQKSWTKVIIHNKKILLQRITRTWEAFVSSMSVRCVRATLLTKKILWSIISSMRTKIRVKHWQQLLPPLISKQHQLRNKRHLHRWNHNRSNKIQDRILRNHRSLFPKWMETNNLKNVPLEPLMLDNIALQNRMHNHLKL